MAFFLSAGGVYLAISRDCCGPRRLAFYGESRSGSLRAWAVEQKQQAIKQVKKQAKRTNIVVSETVVIKQFVTVNKSAWP